MKTLAEILKPEIESGMKSLKGRAPEIALLTPEEYNEIREIVTTALRDYQKNERNGADA